MTVSVTLSNVTRYGNGLTEVFDFSFRVQTADTVKVYTVVDAVRTPFAPGSYTVALNPDGVGGTVDLGYAPAVGVQLLIARETPLTQLVSVSAQTRYDPQVAETVWDKLTMLSQELYRDQTYFIGPRGPEGPQGIQGPTGPQGPAGAQGANGNSFTPDASGSLAGRATYNAQPAGFVYLDTGAGNLYIRDTATAGVWSGPFAAGGTGPQGPAGPAGSDGAQGPVGPTGPAGSLVQATFAEVIAGTSQTTAVTPLRHAEARRWQEGSVLPLTGLLTLTATGWPTGVEEIDVFCEGQNTSVLQSLHVKPKFSGGGSISGNGVAYGGTTTWGYSSGNFAAIITSRVSTTFASNAYIRLRKAKSHRWFFDSIGVVPNLSNQHLMRAAGDITLSGELDQIEFAVAGTGNTFTAGTVQVKWRL